MMKKYFLISATYILTLCSAFAQCPPGSISLLNQTAVNDFIAMYPNCETINGDLSIRNSTVTDLSVLNNKIKTVTGFFQIRDTGLTSLNGLNGLEQVGSSFTIEENDLLTDISAFNNLISVGNFIRIRINPLLADISSIGQFITTNIILLETNASLTDLSPFASATSIFYLSLFNNGITNLTGLHNVATIDQLYIEEPNLLNIQALSSITAITDVLSISNNDLISSISGLENLSSVNNLYLVNLTALQDVTDFPSITSINFLRINGNTSLANLNGLESLTSVERLAIQNNGLLNINGLSNLETIGPNDFYFVENSLQSVNLTSLVTFGGGYISMFIPNATDVCGLANFFENGTYTATIELYADGGNITTPQNVIDACSSLSTNEFQAENIKLFPNPVKDETLYISGIKSKNIEVYNLLGKRMMSSKLLDNSLDVSALNPGVFLVKVFTDTGHKTLKLIKQ